MRPKKMPPLVTYSDEEMDRLIRESEELSGKTPEQIHQLMMDLYKEWKTKQADQKSKQQETTSDNPLVY